MSQHAFHHIESHLDISATAYIMQRFAGGEDNESLENLANLGATKENENQKVKRMLYKDGNLEECDTFYNDKGELDYQKKAWTRLSIWRPLRPGARARRNTST